MSARTIIESFGRSYQLYVDGQPCGEPVSDAGYFFISDEDDEEILAREDRDFSAINRLEAGESHDVGGGYAVKRLS